MEPQLCVGILNNRQKKSLTNDWTHKVLIYFYMFRDIVFYFFFKFCTVFLMRNHFILAGTVFSSVRTFVGSILYKWKNNGAEI